MIVEASVDLPEPLGPIRAWISPLLTSRSTPLRISRSSTRTWRWGMSRPANGGHLLRDEFGERGVLEGAHDREAHARPEELGGAPVVGVGFPRTDDRAVRVGGDALDRRDRALERLDDLGHRDVVGRARQEVAAAGTAPALDEAGLAQSRDQVLQVGERQRVRLRDLGERNGGLAVARGELDEDADAVLGLGGEHHESAKTYLRGRVSAPLDGPTRRSAPRRRSRRRCRGPAYASRARRAGRVRA